MKGFLISHRAMTTQELLDAISTLRQEFQRYLLVVPVSEHKYNSKYILEVMDPQDLLGPQDLGHVWLRGYLKIKEISFEEVDL